MGRRCILHIHQHWPAAAQIRVVLIERQPVSGRPVIDGRSAKDRPGLEANYRFAATPGRGIESITCGNEWVLPIAGDSADAPYCSTARVSGPGHHTRWIIDRHAHQPAMIGRAIPHTPKSNIKNVVYDAEGRS